MAEVQCFHGPAAAVQPAASVTAPAPSFVPAKETVYVTRTGKKYHRDGCRYLKSRRAISLDAAIERGYEPCKVCSP